MLDKRKTRTADDRKWVTPLPAPSGRGLAPQATGGELVNLAFYLAPFTRAPSVTRDARATSLPEGGIE